MIALAWMLGCGGWSVDALEIDGDEAVRAMLVPWEGMTQRGPRLRRVVVTDKLPVGCYDACYDGDTQTITVSTSLGPGQMNRALSIAVGRSLDFGDDGLPLSETDHWAWYGSPFPTTAADRWARAVGLGPLGVNLFPQASPDCDETDSAEDVRAVQRSVFVWEDLDMGPRHPNERTILLPFPWRHLPPERLPGGGIRLRGRMDEGYPDHIVHIDLPSLGGDAVWATYPARYDQGARGVPFVDPPGETSWAPGLGAELLGNFPVGDIEIAGAWLESTDPTAPEEASFVVVERVPDGGDVLAVHRTTCLGREGFDHNWDSSYGGRPVFVPADDGLWVVSFPGDAVKMQRFSYTGEETEPRRMLIDPELLYGGGTFEFRW